MGAWLSMPFARDPSGRFNPKRFELFSEPQYLIPPFTRVYDRYQPLPINQLPKIWRFSTLMSSLLSNCVIQCFCAPFLLRFVDERVSRHMSSRTDEQWPTQSLSAICTMECKLGVHLEPDADAFRLWQPSKLDTSKWRLHGFDQYVVSLCFLASSLSHAHARLMLSWQNPSDPRNGAVVAALYVYSSYSPFEDLVNGYMSDGIPITPVVSMDQVNGGDNHSFVLLTNSTHYDRHLPVNFSVLHDVILLDGR